MSVPSSLPSSTTSITPDVVARMIVEGLLTRERACDGKSRFNRAEKAERARDKWAARDPNVPLVVYPCPFCIGWHLATSHSVTSSRPEHVS